jgi:CheY-like chemotaxis protein
VPLLVRILLIDDDKAVLETVSLMLSSDGHTVLTASDARDGLAQLESGERVDLVLTDFAMPDMSGLDVVRHVRVRWPGLRVGVITGSLNELPRQDWGLDVLLTKPVNLSELLAAVRRLG